MAVEIVLVVGFLSLLAGSVAVLVWDIQRRRLGQESAEQEMADLRLRIAELEEENRRLKGENLFLDRLIKKQNTPPEQPPDRR